VTRHALRERRHRLRILLAEDNVVNQRLAVRLVERLGHAVVVAGTARAALEALERERFDLVLMDLQMPDMDGLAALTAIRDLEARARTADWRPPAGSSFSPGGRIPVIAVTAHAMQGDEERGLAAGMDGYVTKPIQPEALAAAIERWLPPEIPPAAKPTPAPVDLIAARRLAGGDEELRAEVAAMFMEGCRQYQAELREAVQAGDGVRIGRIAHTLKGAAGAVGATTAQELAAELEGLSQGGYDGRVATLSGKLEHELDRAREFLAAQTSAQPG
jgi:CheY-like chemotaxis protein/HPt (histidine-containing phosphotransfer) domain-containing protein